MPSSKRPLALIVLDGFGIAPPSPTNAVSVAHKPFFDSLLARYPSMLLQASGMNVGLPQGEVGNSEVGHTTIGSGILRYQSLPRIDKAIEDKTFFDMPLLLDAAKRVRESGKKLHLVGLIGNGGVHASQTHLLALLQFCHQQKISAQTFLHTFTDGRDTAKDIGAQFMEDVLVACKKMKTGGVASVGGRFFGMDRNRNWDRMQKAYDAIVFGQSASLFRDPMEAIRASYAKQVFDEEMKPVVMTDKKGQPLATIEDGDTIIMFNFRADRARELAQALVTKNFKHLNVKPFSDLKVLTFTEYEKGLPVDVLFPTEIVANPLAKIISDQGLSQLHIAETEKYAHVTFFLNGMTEQAFPGEERILVPSPSIPSYDQKPEMSAFEVTDHLLKSLTLGSHDFYAINYANPDMVGHTGNLPATVKAVEAVDHCLSKIIPEILKHDGVACILADHGNAEELVNPITGAVDKEHNMYPVPFVIVGNAYDGKSNPDLASMDLSLIPPVGILSDVAPTMLALAGLPLAPEMTGTCLI
jgi:2,3-bisphosphoglycerate-independent phosphoglycerate mutase